MFAWLAGVSLLLVLLLIWSVLYQRGLLWRDDARSLEAARLDACESGTLNGSCATTEPAMEAIPANTSAGH